MRRGMVIGLTVAFVLAVGGSVAAALLTRESQGAAVFVQQIGTSSTSSPLEGEAAPPTSPAANCGVFAFDKPAVSVLRSSKKKAFAFYFPPFPVSVENKPAKTDYYSQWLFTGDATGRYDLRDRPLPRPVRSGTNWKQKDFETEIRQAIRIGLDGFIWEYHTSAGDQRWNQLPAMLAAVKAVDPGFRIMLSPDLTATSPDGIVSDVLKVRAEPALYRHDGAIVLAPFYPERKPASWWDAVRGQLAAQGVKTALMPLFLDGSPASRGPEWNNSVIGYSKWGAAWAGAANSTPQSVTQAHGQGRMYMAPIMFEDTRTNTGQFWESGNSATLRATMEKAITGGADWVYLRTWNDYSEAWMAPSAERGTSVGDVAAYYLTWFKTGKRPVLLRDALYYFHRSHHTSLPYDTGKQKKPMRWVQGDPVSDQVELLAFVPTPATLVIKLGSAESTRVVGAPGVISFKVPLRAGMTPEFSLLRDGVPALLIKSDTPVKGSIVMQDWIYHGGGGTACT